MKFLKIDDGTERLFVENFGVIEIFKWCEVVKGE